MKTNTPLVSICCIAYNHEKYIRQTIEGFLMQVTAFPIEILIHDDASLDNTANIIREYEEMHPELILPIYQKENQYSKGIKINATFLYPRARGKYIALCEGDDYWIDPYKLQKQVDILERNPRCGLVFTRFAVVDENNNYTGEYKGKTWDGHVFFAMQKSPIASTLTSVIRNEALVPLRKRIMNENLWFVMDIWYWQQIALKWEIHGMDEITAVYRVHSGGITKRPNNDLGRRVTLIVIDVYNVLLNEHKDIKISLKNKMIIADRFIYSYFALIKNNDRSSYRLIAKKLLVKHNWLVFGLFTLFPRIMRSLIWKIKPTFNKID